MSTLTAYRTAPQAEKKAAAELREHGIKACVPVEKRTIRVGHHRKRVIRSPVAPGYVFAKGAKPAFAKHCREMVGAVQQADLGRLYGAARPPKAKVSSARFSQGDRVKIKVGAFADLTGTVMSERGRMYLVTVPMFGKDCLVALPERHMHRLLEPG